MCVYTCVSTCVCVRVCMQALKAEVADRPSLKGGSVWGYEDILRALYPFIAALRKADTQQKVRLCHADMRL